MLSKLVEELIKGLHIQFPRAKAIIATINDSIVVMDAFDESHVVIPEEINRTLAQVASKFNMRTGDLAWTQESNNLKVYIVPDVKGYTITEAHWSTDKNDSHTENDADSSYAVADKNGRLVEIFNTKDDAEYFIKFGRRLGSTTVNLPEGSITIGAGTVPTSMASTSRTKIEELVESFGAASIGTQRKK